MSGNANQPTPPRINEILSMMEPINSQSSTAAAISRLADEIAELRAALVGYQGEIATGADVMAEFRRLVGTGGKP